jgi:hypothetical protein
VRTTLELPDELLRQAKARAALRGMKLKEYVAEALRAAIYYQPEESPRVAEGDPEENRLVLGEDCVFPLIRGECGPEMKSLTDDRVQELLEEEDVERTRSRTRRR